MLAADTLNSLKILGNQLDCGGTVLVQNSGIVRPGNSVVSKSTPGEVIHHEFRKPSATQTQPWSWAPAWQRQRPWAPCKTPQIVSAALQKQYQSQVDEVLQAYPGSLVWDNQAEGMWFLIESAVLPGLDKKAAFLSAVPYIIGQPVKSWAFWLTPLSVEWIGPRHTNFGDGSICAFEPSDGSWTQGGSLVELFDIYTVWAFRHEHLRVLGKWPGHQFVPFPFERITEMSDDEYCGCDNTGAKYKDCCKPKDLKLNLSREFVQFWTNVCGQRLRKPPESIVRFVRERKSLPDMKAFL